MASALTAYSEAGKPIAMCGVAPILAAMVLCDDSKSLKMTLGRREATEAESEAGMSWPYAPTVDKAEEMGAQIEEVGVDQFVVDEDSRLFTTPAFMCDGAPFHMVHDGVESMITAMVESLE